MNSKKVKRILVADDEPDMREQLCELLSLLGYVAQSVEDGQKAFEALQTAEFDIVISDMRMPVMGGIELLKKIREKDQSKPKVLIISGFSDLSEQQLYDMGANGFLGKPFQASTIRSVLSKMS